MLIRNHLSYFFIILNLPIILVAYVISILLEIVMRILFLPDRIKGKIRFFINGLLWELILVICSFIPHVVVNSINLKSLLKFPSLWFTPNNKCYWGFDGYRNCIEKGGNTRILTSEEWIDGCNIPILLFVTITSCLLVLFLGNVLIGILP